MKMSDDGIVSTRHDRNIFSAPYSFLTRQQQALRFISFQKKNHMCTRKFNIFFGWLFLLFYCKASLLFYVSHINAENSILRDALSLKVLFFTYYFSLCVYISCTTSCSVDCVSWKKLRVSYYPHFRVEAAFKMINSTTLHCHMEKCISSTAKTTTASTVHDLNFYSIQTL